MPDTIAAPFCRSLIINPRLCVGREEGYCYTLLLTIEQNLFEHQLDTDNKNNNHTIMCIHLHTKMGEAVCN